MPRGDHDRDHDRKVEHDKDKYDKAGKGRDPDKLKEIPTDRLREYQKHDKDSWRQGAAQKEIERREKETRDYDRSREQKDRTRDRPEPKDKPTRDRDR